MEYLMTWGWAILIISVVLVVLFSAGIFSNSSFIGTTCISSTGFLCSKPVLLFQSGTNTLTITVGENTGGYLYNVIVGVSPQIVTLTPGGFPVATQIVQSSNGAGISPIPFLASGQTVTVGLNLPIQGNFLVSNTIGSVFTGYIWMNYSTSPGVPVGSAPATTVAKAASIIVRVT